MSLLFNRFRYNPLLRGSRPYSSMSKWTCTENSDGSLTLLNTCRQKRINISPDCARNGCKSTCVTISSCFDKEIWKLLYRKSPKTKRCIIMPDCAE